jgi:hypothetical protein
MISPTSDLRLLVIDVQQRLSDARLDVGLVIKLLDEALKHEIQIDVGVNGDVDLGLIMTGEPGQIFVAEPDHLSRVTQGPRRASAGTPCPCTKLSLLRGRLGRRHPDCPTRQG